MRELSLRPWSGSAASRVAWRPSPRMFGYVLALISTSVALLLSLRFSSLDDDVGLLLFLVAVAVSAAIGGLGPALVCTAIGFVSLDLFFETPPFSLEVTESRTPIDLFAFLVVAIAIGTVNARLRTAHQRATAARRQAEQALHSRDEALAIVSHDLRTPLTVIKTAISTVRNPGAPLSDATRLDLLGSIESEVDRLVHFVADALALSRLEGGITPNRQWNALDEVISATLDRHAPALGERAITFDVPDDLPLARFDAELLSQALANLFENVAAHTPPGTPMLIQARASNGALSVEVSDAGAGIPPEAHERVFNKFERLDAEGPGAGLGLAIARMATEAQGGQLRLADSPLGGARFILLLPLR